MLGLKAKVKFNSDATVMILEDLLQKSFGIVKRGNCGTCLLAQIAFSISASTGIKTSTIVRHIFENIGVRGSKNGYLLEHIMNTFDGIPILSRSGPQFLNLSITEYNSVQSITEAVSSGYPVIAVIARRASDVMEDEARMYKDGQVIGSVIRPAAPDQLLYHSWLAVSVVIEDDADYIVLRDTRHSYAFKGYLKVRADVLENGFKHIKAISINVLDITN